METWKYQLTVAKLQKQQKLFVNRNSEGLIYYYLRVKTSGKVLDYCDMLKTT